jgi:hypothetical protein
LLRRTEVKEELRKVKKKEMLNIQLLAIRSPSYSSSSLECAEGKAYDVKI